MNDKCKIDEIYFDVWYLILKLKYFFLYGESSILFKTFQWELRFIGRIPILARVSYECRKDELSSSSVSKGESIYRSFCIRKSGRTHLFR